MSSTLPKFTPADHAKRLKAAANQTLRTNSVSRQPRTSESAGYAYSFVSPLDTGANAAAEVPVTDETDYQPSPGWLPPAELLGLSWTPPLRRFTNIDPVDPNEALDNTADYLGMHVFTP